VIKDKKRMTLCSLESGYPCFGGIFCLHLEGSHFNPEDGGGIFHGHPLQDYAATTQKTTI
jgi:hypothetical protein